MPIAKSKDVRSLDSSARKRLRVLSRNRKPSSLSDQ
jgi:hypothetical protein